MATTTLPSESLIGSLCREMAVLRLQRRRQDIQGLARTMAPLPLRDPLGASLLLELAGRPLPN
jgi:hypothetical protein